MRIRVNDGKKILIASFSRQMESGENRSRPGPLKQAKWLLTTNIYI